jgi:molybdate transport system substrate-binding protein
MNNKIMPRYFLTYLIHGLAIIFALSIISVSAAELHVAVAANFTKPLKLLKQQFEQNTPHHLIISFGATGQLYAQIKHGAPFDLFLAADMKRPERLVKEGMAIAESLSTYAIGQLVLWSPQAGLVDAEGKILMDGQFKHFAIAHPKLAPYGTAAKQVLEKLGLWHTLQHKIVRGHNANQAYQFVVTGNAELGFIALSHYLALEEKSRGSHWLVPKKWYAPIRQGLVLLKKAENNPAAQAFLAFLQSPSAQQIVKEFGYTVP